MKSASFVPKEGTLRSTEAYEAYLRGYHAHDEYSAAGLDEAVADFRRARELDPAFVPAADKAPEPDESMKLTVLAMCYHALHRDKESDASLEPLTTRYAGTAAFYIAGVYAYRGQADAALQWLDRAYAQRDPESLQSQG